MTTPPTLTPPTPPPSSARKRGGGSDAAPVAKRKQPERMTDAQRKAQRAADAKKLSDAADVLRRAKIAARTPAAMTPGGSRGDGSLHLAVIPVGQGDCSIMSTPEGKVVMFDCGSAAREAVPGFDFVKSIKDVVFHNKFIGNSKQLDILITSHPDTDHYNLLEEVLGDVDIATWYHSAKSAHYSDAQTSSYLYGRLLGGQAGAKQVLVNDDPGTFSGSRTLNGTRPAGGADPTDPKIDMAGGIQILRETTRNCTITILAAGVDKGYLPDGSNDTNRGSIVTLIECDDPGGTTKKILICGDATSATEKFLTNTAGSRIKNVDVLQAGHHASSKTSSSPAFASHVSPRAVFACAGYSVAKDHLPSLVVIDRYQTLMVGPAVAAAHDISCWSGVVGNYKLELLTGITEAVYTTGSNKRYEVTI